ncbi:MAG TPA: hypothetical protein VGP07_13970 [Polyangia bacterium]|jgi:hypothetical protein
MSDRPSSRLFALVAVTLPVALSACGRVPGQFEILNDQVPLPGCVIPTDPGVYQGEGTLDVAVVQPDITSAYFFFPLIENNLPASPNAALDPNQIQLSGFQVDITPIPGAALPQPIQGVLDGAGPLAHYQVSWSGGVDSGGGHLSAAVAAFPVELAQAMAAAGGLGHDPSNVVLLNISALGMTNSGQHMTSDPFHFPLHICSGCLVANIANVPACPFTVPVANTGNACNPAQDGFVDCCTQNGSLVCPPTVAAQ